VALRVDDYCAWALRLDYPEFSNITESKAHGNGHRMDIDSSMAWGDSLDKARHL
jgi:hypothetical protein